MVTRQALLHLYVNDQLVIKSKIIAMHLLGRLREHASRDIFKRCILERFGVYFHKKFQKFPNFQ